MFREETNGAIVEGGRAETVVHDFHAVGFPAHVVEHVRDDAT